MCQKVCHNMYYFVNNGEYISKLYNLYWILLLYYDDKICLNQLQFMRIQAYIQHSVLA